VSGIRLLASGLAAAAAWCAGLLLIFGPLQSILADPERQSAKFLAAFNEPPLPRATDHFAILPLGILCIGMIYALTFAWLGPKLPGSSWRKGLCFGLISWALMVPWFEFYLPWNVMREPFGLVLVEALAWLGVLLGVGLATSLVFNCFRKRREKHVAGAKS